MTKRQNFKKKYYCEKSKEKSQKTKEIILIKYRGRFNQFGMEYGAF